MIFNNCGKSLNNYSVKYGANKLDRTKYHGRILSPFRNFNLATQELKRFALDALHELRKEMGSHLRDNINLKIKIFDTLNISPILLHGSEIWGIDCNGKIDKDPADLVENKFIKWLLGVSRNP